MRELFTRADAVLCYIASLRYCPEWCRRRVLDLESCSSRLRAIPVTETIFITIAAPASQKVKSVNQSVFKNVSSSLQRHPHKSNRSFFVPASSLPVSPFRSRAPGGSKTAIFYFLRPSTSKPRLPSGFRSITALVVCSLFASHIYTLFVLFILRSRT